MKTKTTQHSPAIYSINFNYQENAPWNIGKPQPGLIKLFDRHPLEGTILDIGCGAGDLAMAIASRGFRTLGIDLSEKAIEICKNKANALKPEIKGSLDFHCGDALKPSQLNRQFGSIVDSGFYHLFNESTRNELVDELFKSLTGGGRYYLLGFAIDSPIPHAPRQVTQDEIKSRFGRENGWSILSLESAEFITTFSSPRDRIPATCACMEKAAVPA